MCRWPGIEGQDFPTDLRIPHLDYGTVHRCFIIALVRVWSCWFVAASYRNWIAQLVDQPLTSLVPVDLPPVVTRNLSPGAGALQLGGQLV